MNKYLSIILLLIATTVAGQEIDYSVYPTINLKHNKISLNGDDWSDLQQKFAMAARGEGNFNVVYLGDSHVQADMGGSVMRRRLAAASRSAGRGLVIPYRLAGTNQPLDYSISSADSYDTSLLMRADGADDLPFTGVALRPRSEQYTLSIACSEPSRRIRVHTRSGRSVPLSVTADNESLPFEYYIDGEGVGTIDLERAIGDMEIVFSSPEPTVIGGVEMLADTAGTVVHSIGNNGATFASYVGVGGFATGLSALHADLIIIAMGTNESFGSATAASMQSDIDTLLSDIQLHNPQAKILLVGPTECYRKIYRRSKGRRRVAGSRLNTKTTEIARAMRLYAEEHGVAYYNHYAVAGRAAGLKANKILSHDGVHFTQTGYQLWGNLLSDALLNQLCP